MKRKFLFFALISIIQFSVFGQETGLFKGWEKSVELLGGVSRLHSYNTPDGVKYPSAELNLRFNATKKIKNRISFVTGLNYTEKFKRESYFFYVDSLSTNIPFTYEATASLSIDQALSTSNNRALGTPLQLQFTSTNRNLSIKAGLLARYWMYNSKSLTWVLSEALDAGLLLSAHKRFKNNVFVGIEGYYGFVNMYGAVSISNTSGFMANKVVSQYLQLSVSYRFGK
jgi:hypothetical protein